MKQDKKNKTITMTEEELEVIIRSAVNSGKDETKAENDKQETEKSNKNSTTVILIMLLFLFGTALYYVILIVFFPDL